MLPNQRKIRVLVVDDSAVARAFLIKGLSAYPYIEVVGYAINALDAKAKILRLHPDVMTLDVEMPGTNGIDFLAQLLPEHPLPVILVSSLSLRVFDALAAGAVDFVRKPDGTESRESFLRSLAQKITVASCAKVVPPRRTGNAVHAPASACLPLGRTGGSAFSQTIIGLGASTGGTEATLEVLRRLPADIPGMVIVQHMPPGFTKMYAQPVDVLFSSMAASVKCHMVGIIMTGMGRDGASGLLEMRKAGAYTIGQDKDSCVVYGMPGVAHEIGAVTIQASCENIAPVLIQHLKTGK